MQEKETIVHVKRSEFLTPDELAALLNVSVKWVRKQTQAHRIPGQVKIGRLWRYRRSEIEKRLLSGVLLLEKLSSPPSGSIYYSKRAGRPLLKGKGNGN